MVRETARLEEKEMLLKARVEAAEDELKRRQERIHKILAHAKFTIPQGRTRRSEELQEADQNEKRKKKTDEDRRRREEKDDETRKRNVLQLGEKKCRSKDEKVERDLKQRRTSKAASMSGESISDTDL